MNALLTQMAERHQPFLNAPEQQLTLARLYFWNGNDQQAYRRLRPTLAQSKVPTQAWILVRDLFDVTQKRSPDVNTAVKNFLIENHDRLKKEPLLQPIWASILYPEFEAQQMAQWNQVGLRGLASISSAARQGPPQSQLKARLGEVALTLKRLGQSEAEIKEFVDSPAPQVTVAAICMAPKLRQEAINRLEQLKQPKVNSNQWQAFLGRLQGKINELQAQAQSEATVCEKQKRIIAFMPPLKATPSPLCNGQQCYPLTPTSVSELVSLSQKSPKALSEQLGLVNQMLERGGYAVAEDYAYQVSPLEHRKVLLGYLRLAVGDPWNAVTLLQSAQRSPAAKPHSQLLLSRILWRHGNRRLASESLRGLNPQNLLPWERDLFIEMVTDLRRGFSNSSSTSGAR